MQCPIKVLPLIIQKEACSERRPCIVHMCVFENIADAMVSDERRDKFDVQGIKLNFLGYL